MATLNIVTVNATVTTAPAPSTYQATGAIVSQGATTLPTLSFGPASLLTGPSSITPLLASPLPLASLAWSSGTVVATTAAVIPGRNTGDVFLTTIAGVTPSGYNGTYRVTVTGASAFTFALATNPGVETIPGTYSPPGQTELINQVNIFFAQGVAQSVYVMELGPGDQTTGPAALQTWDQANPGVFYSYLVPKGWDASAGLLALAGLYEAPTAKKYFFVTTTTTNYTAYPDTMKSVVALVEAPGTPLTEFTHASDFQFALDYEPSSTNRMTPFFNAPLYDVTPYPTIGNNALLTTLKTANINFVLTGAEGGVSTSILSPGKTLDGQDFSFWYSADWIQINTDRNVANAVIVQSQNQLNPLVYNQDGINRLQDVVYNTLTQAITNGLATGTVTRVALDPLTFAQNLNNGDYAGQNVVNAVPFATYVAENPNDYGIGRYAGLQVIYIPQNGFQQIIFNVDVTNFLSQ